MKRLLVSVMVVVVLVPAFVLAQEPDPQPEQLPVIEEPVQLNTTQQERVRRISEASGVPEEEVLRLRLRTRTELQTGEGTPDGKQLRAEEPLVEPNGKGWGVIARWLGINPGVNGKGTGNKFFPKEDIDLPSLPELPDGSDELAGRIHDKALDRAQGALGRAKGRDKDIDGVKDAVGNGKSDRGKAADKVANKGGRDDKVTGKPDNDDKTTGKPDNDDKTTGKPVNDDKTTGKPVKN